MFTVPRTRFQGGIADGTSSHIRLMRLVLLAYMLLLLPFTFVGHRKIDKVGAARMQDGHSTTSSSPAPHDPLSHFGDDKKTEASEMELVGGTFAKVSEATADGKAADMDVEKAPSAVATTNQSSKAKDENSSRPSVALLTLTFLLFPSCVLLGLAFSAMRRMRNLEQLLMDHRSGNLPSTHPLLMSLGLGPGVPSFTGRTNLDPRNARLAPRLRLLLTDRDFTGDDFAELMELDEESGGGSASQHRQATASEIRRLPTVVLTADELQHTKSPEKPNTGESGRSSVARAHTRGRIAQEGVDEDTPNNRCVANGRATTGHWKEAGCAVCLCPWEVGDEVRTLPCLHRLHTACIDPWLKQNAICPICKYPAIG